MEVYLTKTLAGNLIACNDSDREVLDKFKKGDVLKVDIKKPRNVQFHRKYFALLNIAFNNLPEHLIEYYPNFEVFRTILQLKAGYYTPVLTQKGTTIYLPKSISFASMDSLEFDELFNSVVDIIIDSILVGVDRDELLNEVKQDEKEIRRSR